jgi:hypothetical protein
MVMNEIENITHDEIFNKIMLILCSNNDIVFSQYKLYELVIDKILLTSTSTFIPYNFKYKFIVVLRQLMSNIDNVKVTCVYDVYYAIYKSEPVIDIEIISELNLETDIYIDTWLDKIKFSNYILDNKLNTEIEYKNPESGNTIYHDILGSNDHNAVRKIIDNNDIDYRVKNNNDETPIDCIKSIKVSNLVISNLSLKIDSLEARLAKLEKDNNINNCSIMNFIKDTGKKIFNIVIFPIIIYVGTKILLETFLINKCYCKNF